MKTLIIFTSQTGFTKRYAEWIAKRVEGDLLTFNEAKKSKEDLFKKYDAIVYGGWAMAGSVVNSKWFFEKAVENKEKKLAIFCVGATPIESPDVEPMLNSVLNDDQKKYMKIFYCPGGMNYENMKAPSRLAMKAFVAALKRKKDPSNEEKGAALMLENSYDISDEKYIEPIIEYLTK